MLESQEKRQCRAVVLYAEPWRKRLVLLDEHNGLVVSHTRVRQSACQGALVLCEWKKQFLQHAELIGLPPCNSVASLCFLHKVLELCKQCILEGSDAYDIFTQLTFLYGDDAGIIFSSELLKKIFLCKIFMKLGFWPAEKKFHTMFFCQLAMESIDKFFYKQIDLNYECELDQWIERCMQIHPRMQDFKSWYFGKNKY